MNKTKTYCQQLVLPSQSWVEFISSTLTLMIEVDIWSCSWSLNIKFEINVYNVDTHQKLIKGIKCMWGIRFSNQYHDIQTKGVFVLFRISYVWHPMEQILLPTIKTSCQGQQTICFHEGNTNNIGSLCQYIEKNITLRWKCCSFWNFL